MARHHALPGTFALAGLFAATALSPAAAWEADDVAARLKAVMDDQGIGLDWSAAEADGSNVRLEDVTARAEEAEEALDLGTVTLEEVSEADGHFRVGLATVPGLEHSGGDVRLSLEDVTIAGLLLPKEGAEDPYGGMMRYERAESEGAEISVDGETVFTLGGVHVEMEPPEDDDDTLAFSGAAKSFEIDLEELARDDDDARDMLEDFGYTELSGNIDVTGSWRPSDGRMILSRYDMTVEDAGTLGISFDIGGYTAEFVETLREMGDSADDDDASQGLAMMGLLQQLTFHGAKIRFDDDSLTERALEAVAEEQDVDPGDVANMAAALVPLQVAPYLGEELTGELTGAVETFLDDPQSIEVRAAPESPVPFATLMGAALASPDALAGQIGLAITANEEE